MANWYRDVELFCLGYNIARARNLLELEQMMRLMERA